MGDVDHPALSSLLVATLRAWTVPSPSVNSISTCYRITLSPACLPPAKAYHPQVLDGLQRYGRTFCEHRKHTLKNEAFESAANPIALPNLDSA
jgi:hypothetical protein